MRGDSGRVVIEIDPEVKLELYAALSLSGITLKEWFLRCASQYCGDVSQLQLFSPDRKPKEGASD
jgi:hypothetical protein